MKVSCPSCGDRYDIDGSLAGSRIRCRDCREPILIPKSHRRRLLIAGGIVGVVGVFLVLLGGSIHVFSRKPMPNSDPTVKVQPAVSNLVDQRPSNPTVKVQPAVSNLVGRWELGDTVVYFTATGHWKEENSVWKAHGTYTLDGDTANVQSVGLPKYLRPPSGNADQDAAAAPPQYIQDGVHKWTVKDKNQLVWRQGEGKPPHPGDYFSRWDGQ